jgi:hypothetical protein
VYTCIWKINRIDVKVALKPYLTLGHIFAKPKDPVKTNQKTHAVYSVPCGDCKEEYLGQSKHQFGTMAKRTSKAVSTFKTRENQNTRLCRKNLK